MLIKKNKIITIMIIILRDFLDFYMYIYILPSFFSIVINNKYIHLLLYVYINMNALYNCRFACI